MRNESHTLISIIRFYIDAWRKREGWSRETVVQDIVSAHEWISGSANTGIAFSDHKDTFTRMKVNADRVYRWLDDSGKDTNLLPANFIPSVLFALPSDLKTRCLDDILRPLGMVVKSISGSGLCFDSAKAIQTVSKESSEAIVCMASLKEDASLEDLIEARRELHEAENAARDAGENLDDAIAQRTASL